MVLSLEELPQARLQELSKRIRAKPEEAILAGGEGQDAAGMARESFPASVLQTDDTRYLQY